MTTKRFFGTRSFFAAVAASTLLGACQSSTVDKFPDPGQVTVKVTDQNTNAVSGATVDLLLPENGFVWRSAVTDVTGAAHVGAPDGILPGNYNVRVTPPANYQLNPAVSNSVPITVQSNKTVSLTIGILTKP